MNSSLDLSESFGFRGPLSPAFKHTAKAMLAMEVLLVVLTFVTIGLRLRKGILRGYTIVPDAYCQEECQSIGFIVPSTVSALLVSLLLGSATFIPWALRLREVCVGLTTPQSDVILPELVWLLPCLSGWALVSWSG